MARSWMLGHLLRRCHQANAVIWSATLGPTPTAPQHAVLTVVAGTGGCDIRTVAALTALDKATLTGIVRRLERDGWLRRTTDPADRRRSLLSLTPSARMARARTSLLAGVVREEFLAPLPEADRERLIGHLRQLARVEQAPPVEAELGVAWHALVSTPGHLLRRALQVHTAQWAAELGPDLTGPRFVVLRTLRVEGPVPHARLGGLSALDKATLSGIVDRLAAADLVVREPDPADRRSRLVRLTDGGAALVESALPRARRVQELTAEPVPESDRAWLEEALERLAFRPGVVSGGEVAPGSTLLGSTP